jgi:glycerophosphoryl diester phosphodiesterase
MPTSPLVIAHRGFSASHEENTLSAFYAACDCGADVVELDVQQTADEQIVVFHDFQLKRICNLNTTIDKVTLAEIRKVKRNVPTLREVLRRIRGRAKLLVELKRVDSAKVASIIQKERMRDDVITFSSSNELIEKFANACPTLPRYGLFDRDLSQGMRDLSSRIEFDGVGVANRLVTNKAVITRLRKRDLKVFVWTVNSEHRMQQLADWGVDGIITNHPDRARSLFPK